MEDSEMKKELEIVEEARKKWEEIIEDEKIRDRALRLEIARLDYNTGMNNAREEGRREGFKAGIEEGAERIETIVKEMLSKKFTIEVIAEITKLDVKEIEKIRDK